jgi:tetratricopeptide (TPR) repeat protein
LRATIYVRIASLFQLAGRPDAAIEWYRKAIEFDQNTVTQLARALSQQNQKQEAVQLCGESFAKTKNIGLVYVLADILTHGTPDSQAFAVADPIFQAAIQAFPKDAILMTGIGNCLARQPEKVSGNCLLCADSIEPNNVVLLNNLYGLADIPERAGPSPTSIARSIQTTQPSSIPSNRAHARAKTNKPSYSQTDRKRRNRRKDGWRWLKPIGICSKTKKENYKLAARFGWTAIARC